MFSQLIGCKSLTETHLAVPKEVRCFTCFVLIASEIGSCLIYCILLLLAHLECFRAVLFIFSTTLQGVHCSTHIASSTFEPFTASIHEAVFLEPRVNHLISKSRSIFSDTTVLIDDLVGQLAIRALCRILFSHSFLYIVCCIAHLQHTLIIRVTVGINLRSQIWATGEEISLCHSIIPLVVSYSL